jgi:hypothetical protein
LCDVALFGTVEHVAQMLVIYFRVLVYHLSFRKMEEDESIIDVDLI